MFMTEGKDIFNTEMINKIIRIKIFISLFNLLVNTSKAIKL